jgi:hypothetical protein
VEVCGSSPHGPTILVNTLELFHGEGPNSFHEKAA